MANLQQPRQSTPSLPSSASDEPLPPTFSVAPALDAEPPAGDRAELVAMFAALHGVEMLEWQKRLVARWSAYREGGQFVNRRCGASVPRQSGKSVDGIEWTAFLASMMGYKVLWTDHNYATTCEMLKRFRAIFGSKKADPMARFPDLNAMVSGSVNKTAQEVIEFKSGGLIAFSTRTKSAALGFSFDVVVYDEAQELTGEQQQAIIPTTTSGAKGNMQVIFLGTPTRAGSPAEVFQDMRAEALSEQPGEDMCWDEWGVAEVGDVNDEGRWAKVNPSLGHHANVDAIRAACCSMRSDPLGFAQEYLGYWLPTEAKALISKKAWESRLVDAAPEGGKVAYGVKFAADGSRWALAAACSVEGVPIHVELIDVKPMSKGTRKLAEWLEARQGTASCAAIDGLAGAGALCDRLEDCENGYIVRPRAADAATAAAMMLEAVETGGMTHAAQPALDESATRSTRRKIGSGGGWGWGGEDSAPMEAASLALWAVKTSERDPSRKQVMW